MANFVDVKKDILNYIYARTPLVIVDTDERERVERMIGEIASENSLEIYYYTDAKQVRIIGSTSEHGKGIDVEGDPLEFFQKQIKSKKHMNIVLGDVGKIGEESLYSKDLLNLLYLAHENSGVVVVVTSTAPWRKLSNFGMITKLDFPDFEERIAQIIHFVNLYKNRYKIEWNMEDVRQLSTILKGFSEIQIENMLSRELIGNQGLTKDCIYNIVTKKEQLFPKMSTIQPIKLDKSYKVSGMENLKEWLDEKRKIFFMPDEILNLYDLKSPKGILLVGVPGCGKSLTAKLVAQEWKLPLFRFDVGSLFDKWLGESEKKMRESLAFIEDVSPCILWIDEIEKLLATTDYGNETGKRILGEFLFWVQETLSKVFIVATANNVKTLPYELYRKGRLSEIFYTGLPKVKERREVLKQYIDSSLKMQLTEDEIDRIVEKTEGYSYSDIETAIKEVSQKKLININLEVTKELLEKTIDGIIPISRVNPELVEEIEEWGKRRALNVSKEKDV